MSPKKIALIASMLLAANSHAQAPASGTLVVVPAFGEVTHVNDQAVASFMIEEQDRDKSAAASRVNQKMKQGTEIVRREDPQARLKTLGYYTYPVYPEEQPQPLPNGMTPKRVATGWRVGQYLEVKTTNVGNLPKMTAAVQKVLGLNGIQFGLSDATTRLLDEKRIAATYQNLNERIASIAKAMGRKKEDALLETVDFEGTGNYAGGGGNEDRPQMAMMRGAAAPEQQVSEPSFEPGETTLQMRVVGKVRFK